MLALLAAEQAARLGHQLLRQLQPWDTVGQRGGSVWRRVTHDVSRVIFMCYPNLKESGFVKKKERPDFEILTKFGRWTLLKLEKHGLRLKCLDFFCTFSTFSHKNRAIWVKSTLMTHIWTNLAILGHFLTLLGSKCSKMAKNGIWRALEPRMARTSWTSVGTGWSSSGMITMTPFWPKKRPIVVPRRSKSGIKWPIIAQNGTWGGSKAQNGWNKL